MRRRSSAPAARQRGVALLTAILLVALGTMLAAAMAYRNAMTARRGAATFAFDQSLLISQAAEAIAGYALRASLQADANNVYPSEPWAAPYGPVDIAPGVNLQAWLTDEQGRFNLNNLVQADNSTDPNALIVLQNLMAAVGVEPAWAPKIADWIDSDIAPNNPDGAEDNVYLSQNPPYRAPNMLITSASELLALPGFGRDRWQKIAPYVTALPHGIGINLCSAPGVVLDAYGPAGTTNFSDAGALASNRQGKCFPQQQDFDAIFNGDNARKTYADGMIATTSSWFRLTSIVTIGTTQFALYSLLHQEQDLRVRSVQRSFTAD